MLLSRSGQEWRSSEYGVDEQPAPDGEARRKGRHVELERLIERQQREQTTRYCLRCPHCSTKRAALATLV